MSFDCIVTQGHIADLDPQGGLTADEKLDMFNLSLRHLRENNPDAYIILSGHGQRQPDFDLVDWHYWEPACRPMHEHGYMYYMPAQFMFVDIGLEQAEKMGFDRVVKTRTDCVVQRQNIAHWCEDILQAEDRQMLLTQQTGPERIGDCFMYGNVSDMRTIWHRDNPVTHHCGLANTGNHFTKAFDRREGESWINYVRRHCSLRDVAQIPFLCLRWNYKTLLNAGEIDKVMANELDVTRYNWGFVNNWHKFDAHLNMIYNDGNYYYTQRQFYDDNFQPQD